MPGLRRSRTALRDDVRRAWAKRSHDRATRACAPPLQRTNARYARGRTLHRTNPISRVRELRIADAHGIALANAHLPQALLNASLCEHALEAAQRFIVVEIRHFGQSLDPFAANHVDAVPEVDRKGLFRLQHDARRLRRQDLEPRCAPNLLPRGIHQFADSLARCRGYAAQSRNARFQRFKVFARLGQVELRDANDPRFFEQPRAPRAQFLLDGRLTGEDFVDRFAAVDQMDQHARAFDVAQEAIAQTGTRVRAFDQAGDVHQHEGVELVDAHDAQLRLERRERVVRDFRPRGRNDGEQRGFAGIRQANDPTIGEQLELEAQLRRLAGFSALGKARSLARARCEVLVAEAAAPSPRDDQTLARMGEVGNAPHSGCRPVAFIFIDDRTDRNRHVQVRAGASGFIGAAARAARFGGKLLLIAEVDQGGDAGIGFKDDIATFAAVAPGRPALGHVLFPPPRDKTVAALTGGHGYRGLINELRVALERQSDDVDVRSVAGVRELDPALDQREERVVLSDADAAPRMKLRPALPHDDVAGDDELAPKPLHSQTLGIRVATVAGRAGALLRGEKLEVENEHSRPSIPRRPLAMQRCESRHIRSYRGGYRRAKKDLTERGSLVEGGAGGSKGLPAICRPDQEALPRCRPRGAAPALGRVCGRDGLPSQVRDRAFGSRAGTARTATWASGAVHCGGARGAGADLARCRLSMVCALGCDFARVDAARARSLGAL